MLTEDRMNGDRYTCTTDGSADAATIGPVTQFVMQAPRDTVFLARAYNHVPDLVVIARKMNGTDNVIVLGPGQLQGADEAMTVAVREAITETTQSCSRIRAVAVGRRAGSIVPDGEIDHIVVSEIPDHMGSGASLPTIHNGMSYMPGLN